ncbi:MAG: AAA family ATPase [Bacteroidota bacterium]
MKIKTVEIADFRCFRDFKLELTYPAGHLKAGKPLDKVCLIGQSGTGKTTLLDLLYFLRFSSSSDHPFVLQVSSESRVQLLTHGRDLYAIDEHRSGTVLNQSQGSELIPQGEADVLKLRQQLESSPNRIVYFPVEGNSRAHVELQNWLHSESWLKHFFIQKANQVEYWNLIRELIVDYQEKVSQFRFRISKAVESGSFTESETIAKELSDWRLSNPGILEQLGKKFLNPILATFYLQVKDEISSLKEASYLPIVNSYGKLVPEWAWTTGTQNIILKTVPLFALKPTENDLILIDEPENSLFPDVQAELVNHYTRLAPDSQIFMATHSPIIASYFEPWEVVDLEFNETGKVIRNEHLIDPEKGWHVDNFDYNPKWLSYEGIYHRYFDFPQNSHPEREEKLNEAASLKREAQYLSQQGKTQEAQQKIEEYQKLAQKLR